MESYPYIRNSMFTEYNLYPEAELETIDDNLLSPGVSAEVMEERMRYASTVLNIPMDPTNWTVEQVQRWAMYVLKENSPNPQLLDPEVVMPLQVNGATLMTLSKDDLVMHFPRIGETIYNEISIWYYALNSTAAPTPTEPEYYNMDMCMTSQFPPSIRSPTLTSMTSYPSNTPGMTQLPPFCSIIKQESPDYTQDTQVFFGKQEHEYKTLPGSSLMNTTCSTTVDTQYPPFSQFSPSGSLTSSGSHSSPDHQYEEPEPCRPPVRRTGKHTIQLWQFLKELLIQPDNESAIRWLDRPKGIFKIEDSAHVAKLWGKRKNRPAMNYDKLSRSIRQYYRKGIIKKTGQSKRLVYQFCAQYNS